MAMLQFLWLEDNQIDVEAIQARLADGGIDYEMLRVDSYADFATALEASEFDLILAAYGMSGLDGIAALKTAQSLCPDTPFIFVSASLGEELAVEALKQGATDYVLKQRLWRLVPSVQRALRETQARRDRKRTERVLIEQQQLLEMIALGQPLGQCLAAICTAVARLDSARACFLLTDTQRLTFPHAITPSFPASFGQRLEGASIDHLCFGTCGEAVHRGEPITCADIANDARWSQEWREVCMAHGILACHSTPVIGINGLPFASLMLCFDQARMPTDWEYQLAEFGTHIASIAFERDRANLALRESEAEYRRLFESIDEGFCIVEVLVDADDIPIDYRVLEVNPVFEQQTGIQAVGKTARQLNLEDHWIEIYGQVALTGKSVRFENGSETLNRWFDVYACRTGQPEARKVAIVFKDISERKRIELSREFLATLSQALVEATHIDEIVQTVGASLNRYLQVSVCAFIEINERGDRATIKYDWHQGDRSGLVGVYALPEFIIDELLQAAQAGQPIVIRDHATDPRATDPLRFAALEIGAEINIPLIRDGKWKFSLAVFHQAPYDWRADEIELMQELTSRVWAAVERVGAEAALCESRTELEQQVQKFDATLSTITDYVYSFDRDGRFLYANQVLLDLWGLAPAAAIGKTMAELDYPEAVERQLTEDFQRVFETGETVRSETAYTSPIGIAGYYDNILSPVFAADGTVETVAGSSRNISDRKQAEAALRESETRLRFMLDASQIGEWDLDLTTEPHTAHRSLRHDQIFGYASRLPEWSYEIFLSHVHPDDRAAVDQKFQQTLSASTNWSFECRIIHPDQSIHWIWASSSVYCDPDGTPARLLGIVVDITDRKAAEAALQVQTQLMQIILASIGDGLIVANPQGEFVLVNQAAENLFGRLTNEQSCDDWPKTYGLFLPDQKTLFLAQQLPLYRAIQGESANDVEVFVRPDPTIEGRWVSISGFPIRDTNGDITGGVITCRDVSERRRILQQEQAAREAAERANQLKDEFLAVLSHELRSPLNPILGWTQLLQSRRFDEARTAEALKTIERNAKLQAQLIEDLLDISRIMQGKLSLTAAPISLTFVISAAVETVKLAAAARNVGITLDLASEIAPISGDTARLQQVLWNLLSNAVKFTPNGGQVTVELRQLEHLAQIRVIDTGKGINPQFLPHVFEYFRQEDGSTTRRFGGLGLGLAIVRQIVEMHGGTVKAESQGENQGASFIVQLPIMQQIALALSKPNNTQIDPEAPLANIQILLVDDEPDAREFQAFLLEQNGATITAVASGLEALQALEQFIPDVIISDVGMAEMDGYMLMQQIRARPPHQSRAIPAIALTAYAAEVDQQKAIQAGFQAHITKPIDPEGLVKQIVTLVKKNIYKY